MRTPIPAPPRAQVISTWQILALLLLFLLLLAARAGAQMSVPTDSILRIGLSIGRSLPITTPDAITRVAVANPEIADVVVLGDRDLVVNGKANGETDIVLWAAGRPRLHYRVNVRAPSDRRMVLLAVRLAEVRKDVLRQVGVSGLHSTADANTRAGTNRLKMDNATTEPSSARFPVPGNGVLLPAEPRFLTILSNFGTKQFLGMLEAEEQGGRARLLAEPNLLAADRDSASFLAGGEIPIPVVQGVGLGAGQAGQGFVTIIYREFGVRLRFSPDIVSDSMIKLFVRPEVSSLDYGNAVTLSGFRIPALRTRRIESSVDIRRDQSVILSGLFNDERERVRTGVPLLMNIPILGTLFSSTRWQNAETELVVIITPSVVDPANVGAELLAQPVSPGRLPAIDALRKKPAPDTTRIR